MHVHRFQEEALTVKSGRIGWKTDEGDEHFAGPGETVTFSRRLPPVLERRRRAADLVRRRASARQRRVVPLGSSTPLDQAQRRQATRGVRRRLPRAPLPQRVRADRHSAPDARSSSPSRSRSAACWAGTGASPARPSRAGACLTEGAGGSQERPLLPAQRLGDVADPIRTGTISPGAGQALEADDLVALQAPAQPRLVLPPGALTSTLSVRPTNRCARSRAPLDGLDQTLHPLDRDLVRDEASASDAASVPRRGE